MEEENAETVRANPPRTCISVELTRHPPPVLSPSEARAERMELAEMAEMHPPTFRRMSATRRQDVAAAAAGCVVRDSGSCQCRFIPHDRSPELQRHAAPPQTSKAKPCPQACSSPADTGPHIET